MAKNIDIRKLLSKGERVTLECKKATKSVPNSFWDTYSAFANTDGGIILLGVYENMEENEKFFTKFLGDGLRYALSDFVSLVNGNTKKSSKLTDKESIAISEIIYKFLNNEGTNNMSM